MRYFTVCLHKQTSLARSGWEGFAVTMGLVVIGYAATNACQAAAVPTVAANPQELAPVRLEVPRNPLQKKPHTETANPYEKLNLLEEQLYQKTYPTQAIQQRLQRLEQSVYGGNYRGASETGQRSSQARLQRLLATFYENKQQQAEESTQRTLSYMEKRLWGYTSEALPIAQRLERLEHAVFQQSAPAHTSQAERLQQLSKALPLEAKSIKLTINPGLTPDATLYPKMSSGMSSGTSSGASTATVTPAKPYTINAPAVLERDPPVVHLPFSSSGVSPLVPLVPVASAAEPLPEPFPEPFKVPERPYESESPVSSGLSTEPSSVSSTVSSKGSFQNSAVNLPPLAVSENSKAPTLAWNYTVKTPPEELPQKLGKTLETALNTPVQTLAGTSTYLNTLTQPSPNTWLRWKTLPVTVWSNARTPTERLELLQWLAPWQQAVAIETTETPAHANIWVLFEQEFVFSKALHPAPVITQPYLSHVEATRTTTSTSASPESYRTIVLIDVEQAPENSALRSRLMTQQLGHALGLWGFSSSPNDLMFPANQQEAEALPAYLRGSTHQVQGLLGEVKRFWQGSPTGGYISTQPSTKDIETLKTLYGKALYQQINTKSLDDWEPPAL